MALATADIHVKIDPAIKKKAEKKFKADGINMSDFINIKLRSYLRGEKITDAIDYSLPENLRIGSKKELEEFLRKRLEENEENDTYYTVEQVREELISGKFGATK